MSAFSPAELAYLGEPRLGRLATIDADGVPHVVPLGWAYNPALETIDIGGRDFARTKKFRNVKANPKVALAIDDVLPPWRPRSSWCAARPRLWTRRPARTVSRSGRPSASTPPRFSAGASSGSSTPLMSRPSELIATGPVISTDLIPSDLSDLHSPGGR